MSAAVPSFSTHEGSTSLNRHWRLSKDVHRRDKYYSEKGMFVLQLVNPNDSNKIKEIFFYRGTQVFDPEITIQFSKKEDFTTFQKQLEKNYSLWKSFPTYKDLNVVTFKMHADNRYTVIFQGDIGLTHHFMPIIFTLNLMEPLPLDLLNEISGYFCANLPYNNVMPFETEIAKFLAQELSLSRPTNARRPMTAEHETHFNNACRIAEGSSTLCTFLEIARDFHERHLDHYALGMATRALALHRTYPYLAANKLQCTTPAYQNMDVLNGLYYIAGSAARLCGMPFLQQGVHLGKDFQETVSSADTKNLKEKSGVVNKAATGSGGAVAAVVTAAHFPAAGFANPMGVNALEVDRKHSEETKGSLDSDEIDQNSGTRTLLQSLRAEENFDPLDVEIKVNDEQLCLASYYLLQVQSESDYFPDAQEEVSSVFASLAGTNVQQASKILQGVTIYGGDQTVKTLYTIAIRARKTWQQEMQKLTDEIDNLKKQNSAQVTRYNDLVKSSQDAQAIAKMTEDHEKQTQALKQEAERAKKELVQLKEKMDRQALEASNAQKKFQDDLERRNKAEADAKAKSEAAAKAKEDAMDSRIKELIAQDEDKEDRIKELTTRCTDLEKADTTAKGRVQNLETELQALKEQLEAAQAAAKTATADLQKARVRELRVGVSNASKPAKPNSKAAAAKSDADMTDINKVNPPVLALSATAKVVSIAGAAVPATTDTPTAAVNINEIVASQTEQPKPLVQNVSSAQTSPPH